MSATDETIGASGHTLEDLSAYLDRGRTPRVAAIEEDAECQALLASMAHASDVARALAAEDTRDAGDIADSWYDELILRVRDEVRSGKDLALGELDDSTRTTVTEGALREVVRRAGDLVDDVLVGSVSLDADADGIVVRVAIGVVHGARMQERAGLVRSAVHDALSSHAPSPITSIDVVVDELMHGGRDDG